MNSIYASKIFAVYFSTVKIMLKSHSLQVSIVSFNNIIIELVWVK